MTIWFFTTETFEKFVLKKSLNHSKYIFLSVFRLCSLKDNVHQVTLPIHFHSKNIVRNHFELHFFYMNPNILVFGGVPPRSRLLRCYFDEYPKCSHVLLLFCRKITPWTIALFERAVSMLHNYEPFEGWKTEENCASKERFPLLPIPPTIPYQISSPLANAKEQIFYVQTF